MTFIPGLELARAFFFDCVAPAVDQLDPGLRYGAALIGEGSEVLGYDTPVSTDHDWGPRVQLFVAAEDFAQASANIPPLLDGLLPSRFRGWPVAFPDRDRPNRVDRGARAAGSGAHGVEVHDLAAWVQRRLGVAVGPKVPPPAADWLGIPEQALLSITAGAVFRDDLGALAALRDQLAWFPRDVWLFKLGCQWERVGEEAAFVGRCGDVGDEIGSRIMAGRLVRDAMRIAFFMERRYAPYPKWFGRAFSELAIADRLTTQIERALAASDWRSRERHLNDVLLSLAQQHAEMDLPGQFSPEVSRYHGRAYRVINAHDIAAAIFKAIQEPAIRDLPRIGAVDQFCDSTAVLAHPPRAMAARAVLSSP